MVIVGLELTKKFNERFLKEPFLVFLMTPVPSAPGSRFVLRRRLTELIKTQNLKSITSMFMEVPCCFGVNHLVNQAVQNAADGVTLAERLSHPFSLAMARYFVAQVHQYRQQSEFVHAHVADTGVPWLHVDLAGPAHPGERGSGFGVAVLYDIVRNLGGVSLEV